MKDEYTSAFYDIVKEATVTTGYQLPVEVESYVVMLLADKIDSPNFLPTTSFAEEFMKLKRPYRTNAKELGDTCLFVTGVFPEYGMGIDYYSNLGKASYDMATDTLNIELFSTLSGHFDFIRKFINITITPVKPTRWQF